MTKHFVSALFLMSVFTINVKAAPIANGTFTVLKTAWLPSTNTPCPRVCGAAGARAESENFSVPSLGNSQTSACKSAVTTSGPYAGSGYLYGNNFNSSNYAPFCIVSTINGQTIRQSKFLCLCAY